LLTIVDSRHDPHTSPRRRRPQEVQPLPAAVDETEPVIKSQLDALYDVLGQYSAESALAAALSNGTANIAGVLSSDLVKRLSTEKAHRPLIAHLSEQELANFLEQKLVERHPFYKQADYRLTSDQITEAGLKKLIQKHAS
jgi:hypothetical protein